jgi:hypothetical protein
VSRATPNEHRRRLTIVETGGIVPLKSTTTLICVRFYLVSFIFSATILGSLPIAKAQSDYNKALCVSNSKREEACSVTITNRSIIIKYISGRNELIKRSKIQQVIAKDESIRRGFIFTRVDRRYLYTINFFNVDNDQERITIAFDDYSLSNEFNSLLVIP